MRKVAVLFVQNDSVAMNCVPKTAKTVEKENRGAASNWWSQLIDY